LRLGLEPRRLPNAARLFIVGGLAASFLYAALLGAGSIPALRCHFQTLLGLDCPACGTTRVLLSLLDGDLVTAFRHNPLMLAFVAAGLAVTLSVLAQLATGRGVVLTLPEREKRVLFWGFWAALLSSWAWVVAT
jgi:hypothetical protein